MTLYFIFFSFSITKTNINTIYTYLEHFKVHIFVCTKENEQKNYFFTHFLYLILLQPILLLKQIIHTFQHILLHKNQLHLCIFWEISFLYTAYSASLHRILLLSQHHNSLIVLIYLPMQ